MTLRAPRELVAPISVEDVNPSVAIPVADVDVAIRGDGGMGGSVEGPALEGGGVLVGAARVRTWRPSFVNFRMLWSRLSAV